MSHLAGQGAVETHPNLPCSTSVNSAGEADWLLTLPASVELSVGGTNYMPETQEPAVVSSPLTRLSKRFCRFQRTSPFSPHTNCRGHCEPRRRRVACPADWLQPKCDRRHSAGATHRGDGRLGQKEETALKHPVPAAHGAAGDRVLMGVTTIMGLPTHLTVTGCDRDTVATLSSRRQ